MLYRPLPDPAPPTDADLDADATAAMEREERHLRMLARLAEIGMEMAEALGRQARMETPPEAADNGKGAAARGLDLAAAFSKIGQAVRRTVALERSLAESVKIRRAGLITECASRRAALETAHKGAKSKAILDGLHDAYAASCPDEEYQEQVERLMEDAQEHLTDGDELRGWLDRPVGETVARLCASLGLDPDACTADGPAWRVRRPPTEFELLAAERKSAEPPPPSPLWGGTDGEAVRVGKSDVTHQRC